MADISAGAAGGGGNGDSWVLSIEEALNEELKWFAQGRSSELRTTKCTVFRTPKPVKNQMQDKDTTYTPEGISLGLFHRPGHYKAPKRGEKFKLKMASAFLATILMGQDSRKASLAWLAANNPGLEGRPNVDDRFGSKLDGGVESSIKVLSLGPRDPVWRALCNEVVGGDSALPLTKQLYLFHEDDQVTDDESEEVLKCVLTLDAIAVATGICVLYLEKGHEMFPFDLFHEHLERSSEVSRSKSAVFRFFLDFMKLENQIPFRLLRRVMRILHNEPAEPSMEGGDESKGDTALNLAFAELARDMSHRFLPGCDDQLTKTYLHSIMEKKMFLNCDHPLGCMSYILSSETRETIEGAKNLESGESSKGKRSGWIPPCIDPFRGRFFGAFVQDKGRSQHHRGITSRLRHFFFSFKSKNSTSWGGKSKNFDIPILSAENRQTIGKQKRLESSQSSSSRGKHLSWLSLSLRNSGSNSRGTNSTLGSGRSRNFNVPAATQLHEAGIDLRNRAGVHNCDLLPVFVPGWIKATLYIPKLPRLTNLTLGIWKNLVAYESLAVHNQNELESQFLALLGFLDSLIDTKEDVLLMTRGRDPVLPDRYSSLPEDLARTFNTILVGYPVPAYPEWLALKKEIIDYHNQKWRRLVLDFLRANFSKPWLFISVFAATVLLILTTLQTIYAMLAYYPRT